jgi:hypothetical protein
MRDDSELKERLLTLFGPGPEPVTAEEVINRVADAHRVPSLRLAPRSTHARRRVAWAWSSVVVALVVVLVVAVRVESQPSGVRPASSVPDQVDLAATPKGWVPVDYGDARLSIPSDWTQLGEGWGCPRSPLIGQGVLLVPVGEDATSCPLSNQSNSVLIEPLQTSESLAKTKSSSVINGIAVYRLRNPGEPVPSEQSENASPQWAVPALGIDLSLNGSLSSRILSTLTYSPRSYVVAPGLAPSVPTSWKRVNFGGVSAAVPGSWPSTTDSDWTEGCESPYNGGLTYEQVMMSTGLVPVGRSCVSVDGVAAPFDGLLIDTGEYGPLYQTSGFDKCFRINDLSECPVSADLYGTLVLAVHLPGDTKTIAISIGLGEDGQIARTILYSIRPSRGSPPPTTTTNSRISNTTTTTTTTPVQNLHHLNIGTLPVPTDFACSTGLYALSSANEAAGECIPYGYLVGGTTSDPDNNTACPAGSFMTMGPVECENGTGIVTPVPPGPNTCSNPGGPCPSSNLPLSPVASVLSWSAIEFPTGKCSTGYYFGETNGIATCVPYAYLPGGTSSDPNTNTACPVGSGLKVQKLTGTLCTQDVQPYEIVAPTRPQT